MTRTIIALSLNGLTMFNKIVHKDKLIEQIENIDSGNILVRYDHEWRWFHVGDDQRSCPLLDFMVDVEYKSGTLIFIPDKVNKCKMEDRNK